MNPIIKITNLSKMYRLGVIGTGTIRHDLNRWWHKTRGKEDPYLKIGEANVSHSKSRSDYVWALKDINIEVMPGEVLGIIGKNGAGKSTLLKILSRVTGPTTGSISYRGRIGSLLEVGTGFHPELTGRENIFLNGAILGMTKSEIRRKFDEIVDFAGVERYIETPVKRYSSGMRVRLGFAVAAFLEPDILVVDEVLAVGDAEFQKKAIGKMQDVSTKESRTILFVSHNMQAVSTLTNRCVLIDSGSIIFDDVTNKTIDKYLSYNIKRDLVYNKEINHKQPSITRAEVKTSNKGNVHTNGERLKIEFDLHTPRKLRGASFSFQIVDGNDKPIIHLWTFDSERIMCREPGTHTLTCIIPKAHIYMGNYTVKAYFSGPPNTDRYDYIEYVCPFSVEMLNTYREFEFVANTCTYVEDANWEIEKKAN